MTANVGWEPACLPARAGTDERARRQAGPATGTHPFRSAADTSSPLTTSELARHAGVSLSSASEHAAVLRNAGLVASVPERQQVRHTLRQLGADLVNAGGPPSCPRP
ncbi:MAG: winged helix-turn-helix domain-containing protein [Streptomyces sp.]